MSCREFLSHMRAAIQHAADPLRGEDPRKFTVGGLTPREIEEWEKWMREHGGRSEP
jgi:tRNA U54 and U55 pseudouridine synthase Pus10